MYIILSTSFHPPTSNLMKNQPIISMQFHETAKKILKCSHFVLHNHVLIHQALTFGLFQSIENSFDNFNLNNSQGSITQKDQQFEKLIFSFPKKLQSFKYDISLSIKRIKDIRKTLKSLSYFELQIDNFAPEKWTNKSDNRNI